MIKAVMSNEAGTKFLVLGLTTQNLEKLKAGNPIAFPTTELEKLKGFELVVIVWGETEEEIVKTIQAKWPGHPTTPLTVKA